MTRSVLVVFILTAVSKYVLSSSQTNQPRDTVSLVNHTTFLNCSTADTSNGINWRHYPVGAHESDGGELVYLNGEFFGIYKTDFSVEHYESNGAGVSNLVIKNVKPKYAGKYECRDSLGAIKSAQLIVTESSPVCESNTNVNGFIGSNSCGLKPEELHLSCSVTYHGTRAPSLRWKNTYNAQFTEHPIGGRLFSNATMIASFEIHDSSFICEVDQSLYQNGYYCTVEKIKVWYALGTNVTERKQIKENVNCLANTSSDSCRYIWKRYENNKAKNGSNSQEITLQDVGMYQCEATCDLKGKQCLVLAAQVDVSAAAVVEQSPWIPIVVVILVLVVIIVIGVVLYFFWYIPRKKSQGKKRSETTETFSDALSAVNPLLQSHDHQEDVAVGESTNKESKETQEQTTEGQCKPGQSTGKESKKTLEQTTAGSYKPGDSKADPFTSFKYDSKKDAVAMTLPIVPEVTDNDNRGPPYKRKYVDESPDKETVSHKDEQLAQVTTLKAHCADNEIHPVTGITLLNGELFISYEQSSEIEVFKVVSLGFAHSFKVPMLRNPIDITSCSMENCLYILCSEGKIIGTETSGEVIVWWSTEGKGGGSLSVTEESNVVLSQQNIHLLQEYKGDGQLLKQIALPANVFPFHALKLSDGCFLVSYGGVGISGVHGVCKVNGNGEKIKEFGGVVRFPKHLSATEHGKFLILEQKNSRVLLMNDSLKSAKEILSKKDGLSRPVRCCRDVSTGMLFVADCWQNAEDENKNSEEQNSESGNKNSEEQNADGGNKNSEEQNSESGNKNSEEQNAESGNKMSEEQNAESGNKSSEDQNINHIVLVFRQ